MVTKGCEVTAEFTKQDIEDCRWRIAQKERELARLRYYRLRTEFVEAELTELSDTLAHLEHHRRIFEYSLRSSGGVRFGFIPLGAIAALRSLSG